MAASATFALKAGVWFRRGRLLMVSPDSRGTACPPSGRNSTYRPVQISGTSSVLLCLANYADDKGRCWPSQERIAQQTEQSVDTVQRRIKKLEELGLLARN